MMASGTAMGATGDSGTSSAGVHDYESIWNGRDELIHRATAATTHAGSLHRGYR